MAALQRKNGAEVMEATGPAGPPLPYCTFQCYERGKRERARDCTCKACNGDAHGQGRPYAFEHGFLKASPVGARREPVDQQPLFTEAMLAESTGCSDDEATNAAD